MKRNLKITAAVAIIISMLTGCGANKEQQGQGITPGMANAEMLNDMKNGEAVDGSAVVTAFTEGLNKAEATDSATIDTEVTITMTEAGETISSTNATTLKYMPGTAAEEEQREVQTAEDATGSDTATAESERVASVAITNTYNGESSTIDGYYEDGYLYYTLEEQLVKETMTYDDLVAMVGSYALSFTESVVEDVYKIESDNETEYIIRFDESAMSEMMTNNMANAGSPLGSGEDMILNEAYLYFVVDKDGYLEGFDMEIDAKFISTESADIAGTLPENTEAATGEATETVESPFTYSVTANFTEFNNTKVEKLEGLDTYRDVNEVIAEMEQQAAEENSIEETTVAENTQVAE